MSEDHRSLTGDLLALAGVVIFGLGPVLTWIFPERYPKVQITPLAVGAVLGWVGFYLKDPKGAKEGGNFLVGATSRIVQVFRTGKGDTTVITTTTEVSQAPQSPSDESVSGGTTTGEEGK